MVGLIRDTAFGQIVRVASGRRYFKYPEEENHDLWKKFIDEKKSGHLAHHGSTAPPEDGEEINGLGGTRTRDDGSSADSETSSKTHVGYAPDLPKTMDSKHMHLCGTWHQNLLSQNLSQSRPP